MRLQPAFYKSRHHSGCDNSLGSWSCLGKKRCQLVAAFTRAGHISSLIFRLDFKTTLENRLKGKPRNSTWTAAEKWKVSDYSPKHQSIWRKAGQPCPICVLSSLQKQGESLFPELTVGSMNSGWSFPFLNICALFKGTPSGPHCSSPLPSRKI